MGMTLEQYWLEDPLMVRHFREADRIKKQQQNEFLWLQGLYNYEGLCAALSNAFSKNSRAEYPKNPHPVYDAPPTEEEKQLEIQRQRQAMHDYLDSVVKACKARRGDQEIRKPM